MKKTFVFLRHVFFLAAALIWVGCPNQAVDPSGNTGNGDDNAGNSSPPVIAADPGDTADAALVPASKDISVLGLINPLVITFSETAPPEITGGTNTAANVVGNHVAVTLSAAGAKVVAQGLCADSSLTFSGDHDFNLYLNGAGLTNPGGAVINNDGTGRMNVTLVEGTVNRLIDGAGGSQKAAFYSKGDFSISGGGSLEVRGKTAHAIAAKGSFTQTGGTIWVKESVKDGVNAKTVSVSGGAFTARTKGDGIQGDDGVTITGGTFSIITTADEVKAQGVKSDGNIVIGTSGGVSAPELDITVYGSGSKCISADGDMAVHSGNLTLKTAGNGYWDTTAGEADKTTACAGIKCDGNLLIDGGALAIVSTGTGGKGISVDGDISIDGGTLDLTTTGAAYVYSAAYDTKSKAIKSDNNLTINDGTLSIKTYTDGAEGLECEYALTINGGTIEINSYDDAINASGGDDGRSGHILITGGNIFCNSSGNDGIDSNGTITISGGTVIALGTTTPEEGFDCDNNTFAVTGGTLIGFGSATSKPTASATSKCTVECNVSYASLYHIEAADGTEIMTFKMPRTYGGTVCMLFGGGEMTRGTSYTLYSGGSVSGGTNFHGLYSGAVYTKGTTVGTFTGSAYANVGTASGSPGPGGQPGTPGAPPRR
ncbi:MAG: carbohydrate-binding domain-containing protein [Treponema sp.]|nr:carbohydrate-binding domain-containing protein [Treponema sp.]